jgi:siroheme synthase-like protein
MDFKVDGKVVVVVGGGFEGCRKLKSFLDSSSVQITVVSAVFSDEVKSLAEQGKVKLVSAQITDAQLFVENLCLIPDVFLAVTDDSELNAKLVRAVRRVFGCLVYCVSDPSLSDFILPAVARVGEVRVAVSTGGQSPVVARVLRQRIERLITSEDLLAIELQVYLRKLLKSSVSESMVRSKFLNEILNNVDIKQALGEGKLNVAKELSLMLVQNIERYNIK